MLVSPDTKCATPIIGLPLVDASEMSVSSTNKKNLAGAREPEICVNNESELPLPDLILFFLVKGLVIGYKLSD